MVYETDCLDMTDILQILENQRLLKVKKNTSET